MQKEERLMDKFINYAEIQAEKGNYSRNVSGTGSAGFARRDCKQENHFAW